MYSVDLYGRVRRACNVEGMSIRDAARVLIARQQFLIHRSCDVGENASPVHVLLRVGSRCKVGIVRVVTRGERRV